MDTTIGAIVISALSGGLIAGVTAFGVLRYWQGKQDSQQSNDYRRLQTLEDWKDTEALRDTAMEHRVATLESQVARHEQHVSSENEVLARLVRIETICERLERKVDNGHG